MATIAELGLQGRKAVEDAKRIAEVRKAAGIVPVHPSIKAARESLEALKEAPHDVYNEALNQHVERIGKTITGSVPGGTGTGYSVGHNASRFWYTTPEGKLESLPTALMSEIPKDKGYVIHQMPREELIQQLGGPKADPAIAVEQAREATAAQQAEAQKLIEAARQRDMVQRAEEAIKTENAARNEAALNAELAQANALKQQGNMAQRAGAAGVEGDIVDLAALLGEKRSQVPPAVELARQTIPIPNQPAAAASAAASAPARGPWSPAPPSPTSVPSTGPLARPNQFTLNRPSIEGSVLGAAAAGGAGALAYDQATDGGLRRQLFPDTISQPELDALPAGGQSYRYDRFGAGPWNNPPEATSVTDQARDILRARLAVPTPGSIQPPEGTDVAEFSRLDYATPPAVAATAPASVAAMPVATPAVSRPVAANTARNVIAERAAPAPTSSGADKGPGVLSSIFSKVYDPNYQKGASQADLWKAFNEDPDNKAAYFRAARNDTGQAPSAEKRGGSVNGKDAVLHKALEIIHHMMVHGKH